MGYAAGFQSGSAVAQRALDAYDQGKQRRLKEQLGQEGARYGVTEGAYGQGLGENIQQVRDLQRQAGQYEAAQGGSEEDIARAESQFAPSIQELTRRQGLTAPDFSVGSRETNFGTRQEARQAAAPMRTEGLSNVYREAGEIEKADELEARAFEQQRSLAQETRAQAQFKQQQESGEFTLQEQRRAAAAAKSMDDFNAWTAENPGADLAAMKNAAKQFKLSSDQVLGVTARMAGLQENELKLWKGDVSNAIKGKSDAEMVDLFNTDDRFDPTTDMERKVGRDGSVTLTLKRKDGAVVSTYKAPDAAAATAYLRKQALEPETLADWLLDRKKTEQAIATSAAQAAAYGRSGQDRGPRTMSEADVTARAKVILETGEAKTFTEAVAMARQGDAYMSPVDRLIANMAAAKQRQPPPAAAPAPAGPTQGLFRDAQGRVQLLQPLTSINQMRQRMVEEQNANDAAYGLGNTGL